MTSPLTPRDPVNDQLLTPQNCALLIIDYQPIRSRAIEVMRSNLIGCRLGLLLLAGLMLGGSVETGHSAAEVPTPAFQRALANVPGKKLVVVRLDYAPGAKSKPHHHAPSAFIYAYVLSGEIRSQVGDEPVRIYRAGESFYEDPGAAHRISENASRIRPASLLAVFVVDNTDGPLTTPDK